MFRLVFVAEYGVKRTLILSMNSKPEEGEQRGSQINQIDLIEQTASTTAAANLWSDLECELDNDRTILIKLVL